MDCLSKICKARGAYQECLSLNSSHLLPKATDVPHGPACGRFVSHAACQSQFALLTRSLHPEAFANRCKSCFSGNPKSYLSFGNNLNPCCVSAVRSSTFLVYGRVWPVVLPVSQSAMVITIVSCSLTESANILAVAHELITLGPAFASSGKKD